MIEAALALHKPDPNDSIDVLHKVGGLDIAGAVRPVFGCGGAAHSGRAGRRDFVRGGASRGAIVSAVCAFYDRSAQIGRTGEHFTARCTRQAGRS